MEKECQKTELRRRRRGGPSRAMKTSVNPTV